MKALYLTVLVLFSSVVQADQRFETVGGFCHFILNPDNDDNEVFFANCENSITQNNDGSGEGSTHVVVKYPLGGEPIVKTTYFDNETAPNIPCVMVDSNGTTYVSNDWYSKYKYRAGRRHKPAQITFSMVCSNGRQQ